MKTSAKIGIAMALAVGVVVLAPALPAQAQSKEEMVRSLQGRGLTRSLAPAGSGMSAQHRSLIDGLKGKATRQITVEERTELATVAKQNDLPSIDLEIYFDYDSAAITQQSYPKLIELGKALIDDRLKGSTFLIAGHTDARGSDPYNQGLSERRADSVRQFLAGTFKVDPRTLIAVGYGEEQLKLPQAPEADQNRRVQVINLAGK